MSASNEHQCELRVRSYECDRYGHVNNAVYLQYLEFARHEFMKWARISVDGLTKTGHSILVSKVCIQYRRPALFDELLVICTRPVRKRRTSGVFHQEVYHGNQLVADADVTWVCVDSRGVPAVLPPEFDRVELSP